MAEHDPRNRAPARLDPRVLSIPVDDDPPPFDANGFDPAEFEWRPVPRRPRTDGWTPDVQRAFIDALADTGMVDRAAEAVDMSVSSAYRLRRAAGSESFARAWDAALAAAAEQLVDIAFARVIEGEDIPVFDRDGCRIGGKRRYSDRMMMFLLRAYLPERFRHALESVRHPNERAPAAPLPVRDAITALAPVVPVDPHCLMSPDRLEAAVENARGLANVDALYPPDDREHFKFPRRERDHPKALARRQARHERTFKPTHGVEEDDY